MFAQNQPSVKCEAGFKSEKKPSKTLEKIDITSIAITIAINFKKEILIPRFARV
jgi:hypothetical protein